MQRTSSLVSALQLMDLRRVLCCADAGDATAIEPLKRASGSSGSGGELGEDPDAEAADLQELLEQINDPAVR